MKSEAIRWLGFPLHKRGKLIREGLDVSKLSDNDLAEIYQRMNLIMTAIENKICEGRLMDMYIFNKLEDMSVSIHSKENCTLEFWYSFIVQFGDHYRLNEHKILDVTDILER